MYAQEKYVAEPPTMEPLSFTVQQYLGMRVSACTDHYHAASKQPVPLQNIPNQVQLQTVPPPVPMRSRYPRSRWLIDNNRLERVSTVTTRRIL